MKILIRGYYGFGNLGDDILMITTYKMLKAKYPRATFFVFSNFNENLKGFNRNSLYNRYIFDLLDATPCIIDWTYKGRFDLVVDGGGGVFFDYQRRSWLSHFRNKLIMQMGLRSVVSIDRLLRKFLRRPARISFKQRIGLGLGIGPYAAGARLLYTHMADIGSFNTLIVRDDVSYSFLERMRFPGKRYLSTDIAFLDHLWIPADYRLKNDRNFVGNVALILMDWNDGNEEVFLGFRTFAKESRSKGYRITFFSFDENHDSEYLSFFNDEESFTCWQPAKMPLSHFLGRLAKHNIVITARAHGAIIGGQLGAVPICLGKTDKLRQVAKMFPSSSILINDPLDIARIHQSVEEIRGRYEHYRQALVYDSSSNKRKARKVQELVNQLR